MTEEVAIPAAREVAESYYVRPRPDSRVINTGISASTSFLTSIPRDDDALAIALEHIQSDAATAFDETDLSNPLVTDQYVSAHNGVTHLYLRQRFRGIEVYNGDLSVNLTEDGKIINLNNGFVPNLAAEIEQDLPALTAEEALKRAAAQLQLDVPTEIPVKEQQRGENRTGVFEGAGISLDPIPTKLMYLPVEGRKTRMVWNTALRLPDRKRWLELNIDAENGDILSQTNWIADSGYRVFPLPLENPNDGPRTLENNPHDVTASPYGWHDVDGMTGAEFTDTRGNNVDAQEDLDADNAGGFRPDGGAGLNFDFALDLSQVPDSYLPASVTNLFYWNNLLHDLHYHYGFDEPAGNFQFNNYGNGGEESDQVKADLLDGSGSNNANFGTPPDGRNPRMQMFVWSGPAGSLTINSPAAIAATHPMSGASFGPVLDSELQGNLVMVNDGSSTPTRACAPLINAAQISGNFALVDRGGCSFPEKAYHSQLAGARAVIIVNNVPGGDTFTMGGWDPRVLIPVFMVSYEVGQILKDQLQTSAVSVSLPRRVDRDSALDNGVIIHEYGHGVTNRLTGGPSNASALSAAQSRGMGEGWSDWWALVFTARPSDKATTSRGIGTYLLGQDQTGRGIRPAPYTTDMSVNSLTYGDVSDPFLSVRHGIGTIWATALWEVYWTLVETHGYDPNLYEGEGGNNIALQLVMDGLKLQPSNPTYLDARDAILMADQINYGGANQDILWAAFAKRGMGISAFDGGSASSLEVRESFDTPNALTITPGPADVYETAHLTNRSSYSGSKSYTLRNTGLASLNWTASAPSNWLDLDVESGTLSPGQSVEVRAYLTNYLRNVGARSLFDTITFTNTTDGVVQERRAHATVSNVPYAYDYPFLKVLTSEEEWKFDSAVSMDGEDSARSGDIGNNESSWMETVVNGPDTLTFSWKVSSELHFDFLSLLLNGEVVKSISGEVDWTKVALEIPDGTHTVRWEYSKDYSLDGGDDSGWVDMMDLDFSAIPVITSSLTTSGLVGRPFTYQIEATYSPSSYTSSALPPGLSLDQSTGIISGTPSTFGTFDVAIAAQNGRGSSDRDRETTLTIGLSEVAPFPFSDNFESGSLSSYWLTETTNIGRVYPSEANGPRNSWHLIMDTASNQGSRGELTIAADLEGEENVVLSFYAKEFSDESNGPPAIPFTGHADFDGVAISEDGETWYEVLPLRSNLRSSYNRFRVDLDSAARQYGLSYNSAFHIRFNHYGTQGIPADGIAIDDISLESSVVFTTLDALPGPSPDSMVFSGIANSGSKIQLVSNLDGIIGSATANGNGYWTIEADRLSAGNHLIIANVDGIDRSGTRISTAGVQPGKSSYELIPFGSLWKYLDDGSDLYSEGSPFFSENHFDGHWKSGNARLGFGGDGEITTIDYGPDPSDRHMVTYFRKQFVFDARSLEGIYDKVILSLIVDDGAAVFLNGNELTRVNMHVHPLTSELRAYQQRVYDEETAGHLFEFDPSLLKDGVNLLAVAVHLYNDSSNDMGFDLRLALTQDLFADGELVFTDPNAEDLLVADINRDGLADLIYLVDPAPFYPNSSADGSPEESSNSATVDEIRYSLARRGGGFDPPVVLDAVVGVDRIRIGDLDNDGDPDLIAADREDPTREDGIRVYQNDDGTFTLAQHLNNFLPIDIVLADFNDDGFLDLAHQNMTSYANASYIVWRANDQNGQFGSPQNLTLERNIWSLDAGDMDSDGDMDIIAAGGLQDQVIWWRNNGTGSFSGRQTAVEPSPSPRYFALGDLDGDDDLDYISSYGDTAWYANRGNGVLRNRKGITFNENSSRLTVADFDQDGDLDLAYLLDDHALDLEWNENDGNGIFTGPRKLAFGSQADLNLKGLTSGDFDGDGDIDLIGTEENTGKFILFRNKLSSGPTITSFTADDNTVEPLTSVTLSWDAAGATEVRLNGDIVELTGSQSVQIGSEDAQFLLTASDPNGTSSKSLTVFVPQPTFDLEKTLTGTFAGTQKVTTGDLDGDGSEDLIYAATESDELGWLSNNGSETFSVPSYLDQALEGVLFPIARDFDQDGDIDIAALSLVDPLAYFENEGNGSFATPLTLAGSPTGSYMLATDANDDGWLDLVVSETSGNGKVYLNDWNGGWDDPVNLPAGGFDECRIIDVTGDGIADFLYSDSLAIHVIRGTGTLQFSSTDSITISPNTPVNVQSIEVADFNGDGQIDIVMFSDNSVAFFRGSGGGQFEEAEGVFLNSPSSLIDSSQSDLDGDGDLDFVILRSSQEDGDGVFWIESDGRGAFSEPQLVSDTIPESRSLETSDINLDGDPDLLLAGDQISWIKNITGSIGAPRMSPESDTGEQDNRTSFQRPGFSGFAAPGTIITAQSILDGSENGTQFIGTAVTNEFGEWSFTAEKMIEGIHLLSVQSSTGSTSNLVVTIDTSTMPPNQLRLTPETDDGGSSTDGVTTFRSPIITGRAEAGSTVVLTSSMDGIIGSGRANDEFWITPSKLSVGTHQITAVATDSAGNVSNASSPLHLIIALGADVSVEQPAGNPLVDESSEVSFGATSVGFGSELTFTIRNEGGADLTNLELEIGGSHASEFSLENLETTVLQSGEATTFKVTFTPTVTGSRTASLQILSNDSDEASFDITLSGIGAIPEIDIEQPAGNDLTTDESEIDFDEVDLSADQTLTFTVRSSGTSALSGLSASIFGDHPSDFSLGSFGATEVEPGEITTFTVTFSPNAIGPRNAVLQVNSNDGDENPFNLALTGNGIHPEIEVEGPNQTELTNGSSTIQFESATVSNPVPGVQVLKVRNTGTTPLSGLAIIFEGSNPDDFSTTDLNTTEIAPGESIDLPLTFSPTADGERRAELHIQSNDADKSPFMIELRGARIPPESLQSWAESFGLSGASSLPDSDSDFDGHTLLEEYAYNLDPLNFDGSLMDPETGSGGLPLIRVVGSGEDRRLEVNFLRRRDDPNLSYLVEFGNLPNESEPDGFTLATEAESTSPVDSIWSRASVLDSTTVASHASRFARVRVVYEAPSP